MIGVIYRPNCKLRDFIFELEQLVSAISEENKTVFLMGDWNLNLMNHSCHQATGKFLDLMFSKMFFPLITRPTRRGYLNFEPGFELGSEPGFELGSEPGFQPGFELGSEPGFQPGFELR